MTTQHHYHMASLKREQFSEKLSLHRIVANEMAIVYAEFQQGAKEDNIKHSNEEFFYVVSGCLEAYIGNTHYTLKAGDGLLIPSNEIHGFSAIETAIALITFAPPINKEQAEIIKENMKK